MSPDLDHLADDHLDDLVDDAVWQDALATHGEALVAAIARARARRAAVASLPRPGLDQALRDRLLLAAPRPRRTATIAPRWWILASSGLAAAVLVLVLRNEAPTGPSAEPAAPDLAARTEREAGGEAAPKPGMAVAPQRERPSLPVQDVLAKASAEPAEEMASSAEGLAQPMALGMAAPGPHELVLAWAAPEPEPGQAHLAADAGRSARAGAGPTTATAMSDRVPPPAAVPAGAGLAEASADTADHDPTGSQRLSLTIRNRTITPWTVAAEDIRIEALDADGMVVWRGRILAEGEVVVAAGATATLFIDDPAWPATTRSLRAAITDLRSPALPIDAQ